MCFAPQWRALFSTSQLPKVVRGCGALYILTWKCASRHNGVHFFNISTSKSGPNLVCFVHFDLEMCFAPQRRALFRHLNFQKWSAPLVFCPFWLGNVLRATTACTFSCLIWPAGSAPAALASLLFDPPEPQIIGKTQWIATFLSLLNFLRSCISLLVFPILIHVQEIGKPKWPQPGHRQRASGLGDRAVSTWGRLWFSGSMVISPAMGIVMVDLPNLPSRNG